MKIEYKQQTLCQLLDTGAVHSVLFQFRHGIGDCVSFYCNVLPVLADLYPNVRFAFAPLEDQRPLFPYVDDCEANYDLTVLVTFPCSEWDFDTDETKAEKCLHEEMGVIKQCCRQRDVYRLPYTFGSPLVGVHFFSTSCEDVSCSEDIAEKIWRSIERAGLIPIDTHFYHDGAKIERHPFAWETRTVDDPNIKPSIGLCDGLISACAGFAGVSGGNFWLALAEMMPQCILYIETEFPVEKLTREPVFSMKEYDQATVDAWLDAVKEIEASRWCNE